MRKYKLNDNLQLAAFSIPYENNYLTIRSTLSRAGEPHPFLAQRSPLTIGGLALMPLFKRDDM